MGDSPQVAGLGQCSLDYIALLDSFPEEDTKLEASDMTVEGGGPVATALVSLARLGVSTYFMGRISDDDAGVEIKRGLEREGVDIRGLKTRKDGASQTAFILVNRSAETRTIIWRRPTVDELDPREVSPALIKGRDMLLLDGLMSAASMRALKEAKSSGVPVMLDAGRVRPGMLELAEGSDYIVCSGEFAAELADGPRQALERLAQFRPKAATVTLGSKGSLTWSDGEIFAQKAFHVRAVDTTGAGDVFHGGYIYGLVNGWDIRKTVEFASAFAALKCLKPGGRAGIPTLEETIELIGKG